MLMRSLPGSSARRRVDLDDMDVCSRSRLRRSGTTKSYRFTLNSGRVYRQLSLLKWCQKGNAGQFLAGLIIRVPPRIASAITPPAMASQLPAATKAPVAAQLQDDRASVNVATRDEV